MADFGTKVATDLAYKAGQAAIDKATTAIIEQNRDQYNIDDLKEKLLAGLQGIKDDTDALQKADIETACDRIDDWHQSKEPKDSDNNIQNLNEANNQAAKAFRTAIDPLHKMTALSILVYANYHHVTLTTSLEDGSPNWAAGKRGAQGMLRRYVDNMEELKNAAEEELGIFSRKPRFFKDGGKRRKMLISFITLSAAVSALPPSTFKLNVNHPRFERLEDAVSRAIKKDQESLMLASEVKRILLAEPLEICTLQGHTDGVLCCAAFANGTRAISGSDDNTLKVWELETGRKIHTLEGHTDGVNCCAVLTNGAKAISGSRDETLKVLDLGSGEEIHTLGGHTAPVMCCAVFTDGRRGISGSWDSTLKVWDLKSGEEIHALEGHTKGVSCCAVFADDTRAISGSGDNTLGVWDLESGEEIHTLEGHTDWVYYCAVSADGTRAVSGSDDNTLKVWDLESGKELNTLEGHTGPIDCCAVFADGTRAISGSHDNTLNVWDLVSGREIHTLEGHTGFVNCCAVFDNGTRAISGSRDRTLKVWNLPHPSCLPSVPMLPSRGNESDSL